MTTKVKGRPQGQRAGGVKAFPTPSRGFAGDGPAPFGVVDVPVDPKVSIDWFAVTIPPFPVELMRPRRAALKASMKFGSIRAAKPFASGDPFLTGYGLPVR